MDFFGPEFLSILDRYGLPVAALFFCAMASWRVCSWLGSHVIIPLREVIVQFILSVQQAVERLEKSSSAISAAQEDHAEKLVEVRHSLDAQNTLIKAQAKSLSFLVARESIAQPHKQP